MRKDCKSWAPRGRAYFSDGAAPDDPGPWLEPRSPIDVGCEYGWSATRDDASIDGPAVEAMVKWFRADKGYGFVELADGQGDAFLHLKALRLAGLESVPAGAQLHVIVSAGPKGAQVARVVECGGFIDMATEIVIGETSGVRAAARDGARWPKLENRSQKR